MLSRLFILIALIALFGCRKEDLLSVNGNNTHKLIAIQPIGDVDMKLIEALSAELECYFNTGVIALAPVQLNRSLWMNANRYNADSLLQWISQLKNDSVVEVIGVSDRDLYVNETAGDSIKRIGVYGLGHIAAGSCIVSTYRIRGASAQESERLMKITFHEVGHNLGLDHCRVSGCLMSEANGQVKDIDNMNKDYCEACKGKLE